MERAAGEADVHHVGHRLLGFAGCAVVFEPAGAHLRHGAQQQPRVGVVRRREDAAGRTLLGDAARVEHHDAVRERGHRREVVADEHEGGVEPLLQRFEQLDDGGADHGVERRGHLVAEDDVRLRRQCAGEVDALLLPAGELVRKASGIVRRQLHHVQQLPDPPVAFRTGHPEVELQRPAERLRHQLLRVERDVRHLQHELDTLQVLLVALLHVGGEDLAVEPHLALERGGEAGDDPRHRGLAAAGLPDDPDRLPAGDVDVDVEEDLHAGPAAPDASVPCIDAMQRQHRRLPARLEVGPGPVRARRRAHRRHELPGVLVLRRMEDLVGVPLLHDLAAVEHDDAIRHLRDHRQIVGHVERGGAGVPDHVLERGQHLDLRGDVDRGGGLVEHQQVRTARHRHHREQALELSPAHLVRVLAADAFRLREPHPAGQIDHPDLGLVLRHRAVDQRALRDLGAEGVGDVERGGGRLRDVGDAPAAHGALLVEREGEHRAPVERHLAAGETAAGPRVGERGQRDGRLAGARLADEREHLAPVDLQRDALDDGHPLAGGTPALHVEIPDPEQSAHFTSSSEMSFCARARFQSTRKLIDRVTVKMASAGRRTAAAPTKMPVMLSFTIDPQSA